MIELSTEWTFTVPVTVPGIYLVDFFDQPKANEISIWPESKGGKRGKSGGGDPDIAKQFGKISVVIIFLKGTSLSSFGSWIYGS